MIYGREKEQQLLDQLFKSEKAEFLAIYGRRRIGKTYLIHEFFKDKGIYLEVTGSNKARKGAQIKRFLSEVKTLFPAAEPKESISDWTDAFYLLLEQIQTIPPSRKFIFFVDELPWFASHRSGFLSALDYFWNRHFSRIPNMLLIICGSAAHWMIKKVINDRGGLHGRLSAQIRLEPFTLDETEKFFVARGIHFERKQLVELYMMIGGVPKYLTQVMPGKSPTQIANELCFSPRGFLLVEFEKLYESLFEGSEKHIAIVRTLAKHRYGMDQASLLEAAGFSTGGTSSVVLQELEEAGFILSIPSLGKKRKERQWRLTDEYSLFYLKWIEEMKPSLLRGFDPDYWNKIVNTPAWNTWAGYAFENLCLKHAARIKWALGLGGITTWETHWKQVAKGPLTRGAEIDLVIERADGCINLCEIKFCNQEFEITKEYAQQLEQKIQVFRESLKKRKTLFLTMITPFGVKKNQHAISLVNQQLTLDALF